MFYATQKNYDISFYFNSLKFGKNTISIPEIYQVVNAVVCENEELMIIIKGDSYCKKIERIVHYTKNDSDLSEFDSYNLWTKNICMIDNCCYLSYME